MQDYGTTKCPEADKYIDDHKLVWKEQAERSNTQGDAKEDGNSSEDEDIRMCEDINVLEDDATHIHGVPSIDSAGHIKNLTTNADYHGSCHLLYATAEPLYSDPILIRTEYSQIYDWLLFLYNSRVCKAVVTGQPGIGNLPSPSLI